MRDTSYLVLASNNKQNASHEGDNGEYEVVVGKGQVDKSEEGPEQKPEAKEAKTEVSGRGGHEYRTNLQGKKCNHT